MKAVLPFLVMGASLFAQSPAKQGDGPRPDAVVVRVGDQPMTAAAFRALLATLPSDLQKAAWENPKESLQSLYLLKYLAAEADKAHFAEQSPVKEQLEMARMQILSQAIVAAQRAKITVGEDEAQKRYKEDPSPFDTAKVSIILVTYPDPKAPVPPPAKGETAKPGLTEAEAKAKADDLVRRARSGENFGELAKKYSEDKASAAKNGEYAVVKRSDNLPAAIKDAVFAQKAGGVTDPIQLGFGYYIIRVDERGTLKFEDAHDELISNMRLERFNDWMAAMQRRFAVTIENQEFFPKPKPGADIQTKMTVQ